jgi:hypothetical protein
MEFKTAYKLILSVVLGYLEQQLEFAYLHM